MEMCEKQLESWGLKPEPENDSLVPLIHCAMLVTMHSNVDPHSVRLRACVHSRIAAGSWPRAAVTLSLNPLLPCRPVDQPRHRTVGSAQHVVSDAGQLWTAARWRWMARCKLLH